jgi:biopolymer transport protein ExbD
MMEDMDSLGSGLTEAGSGERAMSDISLTIGFCMLILVFVLVPYLTILNRIAVNVPATKAESTQESAASGELEIPVFVMKEGDGFQISLGTDKETGVALASLADQIASQYGDKIKDCASAQLVFRADRELSYQKVMDVLTQLNSLEERFGKPVEYHLQYVDDKEK